MTFIARAAISLLCGVGAGTLGFGAVWLFVERILLDNPSVGYTPWLLASIFLPGPLVPLIVFHYLSRPIVEDADYALDHE